MTLPPRARTAAAWTLWLAVMAGCAAGLAVALLVARPLTAQVVLDGALYALGFPLGYATVGLVLTLRRPANPIGWLYAASALTWSLIIPLGPWVDQLARFDTFCYTYVFDGAAGRLDHVLASASMSTQVSGAAAWHINADEPALLDYQLDARSHDLYSASPYRSSDHDPVLVGLSLGKRAR